MWNKLINPSASFRWEVEVHMTGLALEVSKNFFVRGAHDVMDFMYLIKFVGTWEQWE
jgi:hypothetical protein